MASGEVNDFVVSIATGWLTLKPWFTVGWVLMLCRIRPRS
jgi:hypothetical protein